MGWQRPLALSTHTTFGVDNNCEEMRINPFRDGDAHATFNNLRDVTIQEIDGLENDYVLKASPTELEQYFMPWSSRW